MPSPPPPSRTPADRRLAPLCARMGECSTRRDLDGDNGVIANDGSGAPEPLRGSLSDVASAPIPAVRVASIKLQGLSLTGRSLSLRCERAALPTFYGLV